MTGLTSIWAGCHLQLARIADCPELAMDEAESRAFLTAWQNYLRHLEIEATQRTVDLVTACGVTLFCYAPRAMALAQRRDPNRRRQQQQPRPPAQVFTFRPPMNPPPPWQPAQTTDPAPAPAPAPAREDLAQTMAGAEVEAGQGFDAGGYSGDAGGPEAAE